MNHEWFPITRPRDKFLSHEDARHWSSGRQPVLSATDFLETVGLVELDRRQRGVDVDARCVRGSCRGLSRPIEARPQPRPRGCAPDIHGRAVLGVVGAVRREPQDFGIVTRLADRDEKQLTAGHRAHVEPALHASDPVTHDGRLVVPGADRPDGIGVGSRDAVDVGEPGTSNLEVHEVLTRPVQRARNAARPTAVPRRYTEAIRRVLLMSSSGLASSTMKPALLPASTVLRSVSRSNSAELRVAATMTWAGVIPDATMSAISACGLQLALPSVPSATLMPAALSFARLRAWIPKAF